MFKWGVFDNGKEIVIGYLSGNTRKDIEKNLKLELNAGSDQLKRLFGNSWKKKVFCYPVIGEVK